MLSMRSSMGALSTIVVMGALAAGCSAKEDSSGPGTSGASGASAGGTGGASGEGSSGNSGASGAGASGAGGASGTGVSGGTGGGGGGGGTVAPNEMTKEQRFPEVTDWAALEVVYTTAYTAFDGEHVFKVPFRVQDTEVPLSAWFSVPDGAVMFDEDTERSSAEGPGVIVTVVAYHPEITIGAQSGMLGGTATLKVTQATPAEWEAGEARYDNGIDYDFPQFTPEQFLMLLLDPNFMVPAPAPNTSCISCHSEGAKYFEIQHTPTQIARFSDEELTTILTMGIKPAGIGFRILPAMLGGQTNEEIYKEYHRWDGTEAEIKGLLVYLRSLTPTGQGDIKLPDGTYVPPGTMPPVP